jgi:site-specific recombinase XerD
MNTSIRELSDSVIKEFKKLNYAELTIKLYRECYEDFINFSEELGKTKYSIELGDQWLRERNGIDISKPYDATVNGKNKQKVYDTPINSIKMLTEIALHGYAKMGRSSKRLGLDIPEGLISGYLGFQSWCEKTGKTDFGTHSRLNRIKRLLLFLDAQGIKDYSSITATAISKYILTFSEYKKRTINASLSCMRCFLRQSYLDGLTNEDLSVLIPVVPSDRTFKIPRIWNKKDLIKVLSSIDTSNAVGKRDYAILLMIAHYGLRSVDVKMLKLSSIDWEKKEIVICQHKTGKMLSLPLLDDVGNALADYLKNGRAKVDRQFVFLKNSSPYDDFSESYGSFGQIIARRINSAGVSLPKGMTKGSHALRHTLASVMLSQNVPLQTIASTLGHATTKSTAIYLHSDISRLSDCILDPEEFNNENI